MTDAELKLIPLRAVEYFKSSILNEIFFEYEDKLTTQDCSLVKEYLSNMATLQSAFDTKKPSSLFA